MRRNTLLLIIVAVAITLMAYLAFEVLTARLVNASWTSGPLLSAMMHFTQSVTSTISSWGYLGIFILMVLEASSVPIPSEVILPFSGYLVSRGLLNFWATVAVATIGAILGSLVDYYIGLKGYQAITKYRLFGRSVCSESQLNTAAAWFNKYGPWMVFLARLVPLFRTIISFPAGAVRMPLAKFAAYTVAGCTIWNILLIYVGYYLGSNWAEVADVAHYIVIVAVAALILIGAYWFVRRKRRIAACKLANSG